MRFVAGINKNESAVDTIIAIIVETKTSPKMVGKPAYLAMAGITDSLPAFLASRIFAGVTTDKFDISSATKSGRIPFETATEPVNPI